MRIAVGTDERTEVVDAVERHLAELGHDVEVVADGDPWPDVGRAVGEGDPWPDVGRGVGELVAGGGADRGVVCCWTGTGVSMAANKVPGARAALCTDPETAAGARRWNDANVLALGLRLTSPPLAVEMLDAFLAGEPDDDETANIAKLG